MDLAPSNHLTQQALAVVLFFRKETAGCLSAAERALALNPLDGSNEAIFLITFTGDWNRGCALIRWAMELNPQHPRWYELILGINEYRLANYRAAADEVVKANIPDTFWTPAVLAAAYGQLGELAAADRALKDLLAQKDDFARSGRGLLGRWFDPQLVDSLMEGLRKAGLAVEPMSSAAASASGATPAAAAIAVLPFSDMSSAKDQEYLCEGMAEEIMNALVHIEGIRVASRTSTFKASRDSGDLKTIASALSVDHILEGSVRTMGNRLRVTARFTDVASDTQLWSEKYDREVTDLFALQDEIAGSVVEAIKIRLEPGDRGVQPRPQIRNVEAYRHFLQGRFQRHTKNNVVLAMRSYEEAIRLDPEHGMSWVGLAETSVLSAHYGLLRGSDGCARAREALAVAERLQGDTPEAQYVVGFMSFIERRWHDSEVAYRRVLDQRPNHVPTLGSFGATLGTRQRLEDGRILLDRCREADPLAAFPCAMTGLCLVAAGRPEEALPYLDDALAFEPDHVTSLWVSGIAYVTLGRVDEALARFERGLELTRRSPFFLGLVGWGYAVAGRATEALAVLAELNARPSDAPRVGSDIWLLAALGEIEPAFQELARAEAEYQPFVYYTAFPGFDPLRGDPRFAALLNRLGLPSP